MCSKIDEILIALNLVIFFVFLGSDGPLELIPFAQLQIKTNFEIIFFGLTNDRVPVIIKKNYLKYH